MNTDRFKFRVLDNWNKKYSYGFFCGSDGFLYKFGQWESVEFKDKGRFVIEPCTGQKDQHGKLIFEGDVVSVYNPLTDEHNECRVSWVDDAAGYVCLYLYPEKVVRGCGFASETGTYFDGAYCRIIGNIHDEKWGIVK